ncbi:MAG TPA: lamin tail domain-containing protein, partial [Bacteroidota bacterium]|nr:lamin tail domain-containing protein [Bacteroidota bacterium]
MFYFKKMSLFLFFACIAQAEAQQFPFFENFDTTAPPSLPSGWSTTTNRQITGDFTTTSSTVFSPPYAVISTNATISQSLTSPLLDFSSKEADSLIFYERRSSSHNSDLILEASLDGGSSFFIQIGDTLKNPGVTSYVRRNMKIPSSLTNQSMVKIRWRIVGNGTGSTGTLRFDNVSISARAQYDIGIIGISTIPLFPRIGDSVVIRTILKNLGTQQIENTTVNLFNDIDSDSIPDDSELFSSSKINQNLQPDDTISVETTLAELTSSNTHIIVQAVLSNDQNLANNIKHVSLMIEDTSRSLVINEIMFAPSPGKPEWIELFNTSSINVDLRNWKLSNRNSSTKYTISSIPLIVAPQSYLVVTKAKDNFDSAYGTISSPVAEISQMPTFFLNNSGDAVALFDSRGVPIDSVRYSPTWGGTGGKSLERMEAAAP